MSTSKLDATMVYLDTRFKECLERMDAVAFDEPKTDDNVLTYTNEFAKANVYSNATNLLRSLKAAELEVIEPVLSEIIWKFNEAKAKL